LFDSIFLGIQNVQVLLQEVPFLIIKFGVKQDLHTVLEDVLKTGNAAHFQLKSLAVLLQTPVGGRSPICPAEEASPP